MYMWAGVGTCRERARVPIGRGVAYVCGSTSAVRAVGRSHYACTVAHTCSGSTRAVDSNSGASILTVYSVA